MPRFAREGEPPAAGATASARHAHAGARARAAARGRRARDGRGAVVLLYLGTPDGPAESDQGRTGSTLSLTGYLSTKIFFRHS